jgi:hypothetical protein
MTYSMTSTQVSSMVNVVYSISSCGFSGVRVANSPSLGINEFHVNRDSSESECH